MGIIRQLDYGSFGGLYSCINLSQWPRFISGWLGGSLLFCHVPPTCSLAFSHPVAETIRCIRHATPLFCRQSHRPNLFCVCFFLCIFVCVFFSWQPTIDLWLCSQYFKFQVQSLGLTVPTVILQVMKSDSNSVVNIRYIYTGCHINNFSVCTMPKDMRRAVVSSEGRKLFYISPQCWTHEAHQTS